MTATDRGLSGTDSPRGNAVHPRGWTAFPRGLSVPLSPRSVAVMATLLLPRHTSPAA